MQFNEQNYGISQEGEGAAYEQQELRETVAEIDQIKQQVLFEHPAEDPDLQKLLEKIDTTKTQLDLARTQVMNYLQQSTGFKLAMLKVYEREAAALSGAYRQLLGEYKTMLAERTEQTLHEIIATVQDNSYAYYNYDSLSAEEKAAGTKEAFEQIFLESKKTQELYEQNRTLLLEEADLELDQAMVEQRQFEYDKAEKKQAGKIDDTSQKDVSAAEEKLVEAKGRVIASQQKIAQLNTTVAELEEVDPEDIILVQNQAAQEQETTARRAGGGGQKMTHTSRGRLQRMQKRKRTKCSRCRGRREFGKTY